VTPILFRPADVEAVYRTDQPVMVGESAILVARYEMA
jgi:hypothetical protein